MSICLNGRSSHLVTQTPPHEMRLNLALYALETNQIKTVIFCQFCVVLCILPCVAILRWFYFVRIVGFVFDAPGSTESPLAWLFVIYIFSCPIKAVTGFWLADRGNKALKLYQSMAGFLLGYNHFILFLPSMI